MNIFETMNNVQFVRYGGENTLLAVTKKSPYVGAEGYTVLCRITTDNNTTYHVVVSPEFADGDGYNNLYMNCDFSEVLEIIHSIYCYVFYGV